jgi:hypothetical protein
MNDRSLNQRLRAERSVTESLRGMIQMVSRELQHGQDVLSLLGMLLCLYLDI